MLDAHNSLRSSVMLSNMRRVVIVGRGASGKSTLAVQMSNITGLPVTELDKLFWQPGPSTTRRDRWVAKQHDLVAGEGWILDGDLGPYDALDVRLRAADTIILLDFANRFASFMSSSGCQPPLAKVATQPMRAPLTAPGVLAIVSCPFKKDRIR